MAIRRDDTKRVALFCFCARGDVQGAATMAERNFVPFANTRAVLDDDDEDVSLVKRASPHKDRFPDTEICTRNWQLVPHMRKYRSTSREYRARKSANVLVPSCRILPPSLSLSLQLRS